MSSKGIGLDEVKRAYEKEENLKLRKRMRMIMGLLDGLSTIKVAEKMMVSQPNVIYWKKMFEREGLAGLQDRPRPGRPPKVGRRMMERIKKEVKAKGLTKATDVRNLIYKRTGVRYSMMHAMRILHSWDLSRKRASSKRTVNKNAGGCDRRAHRNGKLHVRLGQRGLN